MHIYRWNHCRQIDCIGNTKLKYISNRSPTVILMQWALLLKMNSYFAFYAKYELPYQKLG